MIRDRCLFIIEDKNLHYALISKAVEIIKDKYTYKFTVNQLISHETFSADEKEYLKSIFSMDIDEVIILGEYHFTLINDFWEYDGLRYIDYSEMVLPMILFLNTSKIPLGTKVRTDDFQFISDLLHDWKIFWGEDTQDVQCQGQQYKENYTIIEFISHNLKNKVGDFCIFDFEFLKAFKESICDYFTKKLKDATMAMESLTID